MDVDDPKYKKQLYETYKKQFGYIAEDSFNANLADKDKATALYSNLISKGVSMPKQDEYLYKVGHLAKDPTAKAKTQPKPTENRGGQNDHPTNTPSPTLPKQPQQSVGQVAQYDFDAYNPETGETVVVKKGQKMNENQTTAHATTTKQGVVAKNFETDTDLLAKEQEQRINKLEQEGADPYLIAKEKINLAKDYYRFSEDKEKRKLYDKNQDAFKFLEYQEKLQETATSKGLTVDDYVDNLEYAQAQTFLDDKDKEEFSIIQEMKAAESVLNSFGSQELKGIQEAKLEALKSRYKNFLAKRYEETNSELTNLKRQLVMGDLSYEQEKETKTRITYLENSRNNFFKTDEDKVAEGVKKAESSFPTLVDILPQNLSPSEKFSIYYQTLYQEHQELRKKIENGGAGRFVGEAVGSTFGMQSQEMTRYTELQRLLYDLAPIALINKAPVKGRDGFLGSMYQGVLETIAPVAKGLQGTNLASETNLQNALRITGTEENVTPEIMQGIVSKYKVDKATGTIQGYKNWTREATGQTLGSSLGMMTHMIASAPASATVLPRLGAAWNSIVMAGKAPTVLPRVYNFLSGAVQSGGQYAIAGTIFQQSGEELDFSSGVAGFVGESALKGALSPLKGLAMPLNLLFGANATKVVSQMVGRGIGEVGEETAQSLVQIYNSSPDSTARQKQFQQMFGTWDDTLHFAFQTFVMGAVMGVGSKTGRDINAEAEKAIASLPPDKRAILDKAVEAFEAEVGNATEQAVSETAQELEIEPTISENIGSQEQIVSETQEQSQEQTQETDGIPTTSDTTAETKAGETASVTESNIESETDSSIIDTNRTEGVEQTDTDAQAGTTEVPSTETEGYNSVSNETQQQTQTTQETPTETSNQANQKPKPQEVKAERVGGDKVKVGKQTYKVTKDKKGRVKVVNNKNKPISKSSAYYEPVMNLIKEEAVAEMTSNEAPLTQIPEGATPAQYYEEVAEKSENPVEIAAAFSEQPTDEALFDQKEKAIADRLGKVSQASFSKFGDLNRIKGTAAKLNYFSTVNSPDTSIDTIAAVMSEETGIEITPRDIVDFITKYPSGIGSASKPTGNTFFGKNQNPTKQALADRFKEVTGLELDEKYAQQILEQNARQNQQSIPETGGEFISEADAEAARQENARLFGEQSQGTTPQQPTGLTKQEVETFFETDPQIDEFLETAIRADGTIDFDRLQDLITNDFVTDAIGLTETQIEAIKQMIAEAKKIQAGTTDVPRNAPETTEQVAQKVEAELDELFSEPPKQELGDVILLEKEFPKINKRDVKALEDYSNRLQKALDKIEDKSSPNIKRINSLIKAVNSFIKEPKEKRKVLQKRLHNLFKAFFRTENKYERRDRFTTKEEFDKFTPETKQYLIDLYDSIAEYIPKESLKDQSSNEITTDSQKIYFVTSHNLWGSSNPLKSDSDTSGLLGSVENPSNSNIEFPIPTIEVLENINKTFEAQRSGYIFEVVGEALQYFKDVPKESKSKSTKTNEKQFNPKQVTKAQIKEETQMFRGTVELEPTYFPNLDPKGSLFTQVQKDLLKTGKKALDATQRLARYHALRAVNKAVERFPSLSETDQTRLFNHLVGQSLTQDGVLATANFDAESYKDSEALLKTVPDTTPTTLASSSGRVVIPSIFSFRKRSSKGASPKPTAPFKLFDKIVQLHRKYNKRGKLQQKNLRRGIRGLYYLQIAKVELSALNDMAVAIHELSHAIDDQHGIISSITDPQVKSALIQYYKDHYPAPDNKLPENVQMMEGFAMFIQNYTTDKVTGASGTAGVFGKLIDTFLTKGGKHNQPIIDEFVADIEALIEEFQMLPKIQQIGSLAITDKTAAMKAKDPEAMAQKANREIFDRVSDFENMARASGTAMTSEDVSLAIRTLHSLPTRLGNNLTGKSNFFGIPGVFEKLHQKLKTSWLGKVAKNFSFNEFWGADKNGNWTKLHDFNYGTVMEEIHAWGKEQGMTKDQALEEFSAFLIARRINFEYKELADTQAMLDAIDDRMAEAARNKDEELVQKLLAQRAKVEERAAQLEKTLENDGILESDAEEVYNQYAQEFKSMTDKMDTLIRHDLQTLRDTDLITEEAFQELTQRDGYVPFKRLMDYNEYQTEDVPMLNASQTGKIGSLKQRKGSKKPIINPFISAQANHLEIQRKAQIQRINQSLLNMATKSLDKDHPLNGQFKVIESPTRVEMQEAQNNKAMVLIKQDGKNKIVEFQNPIMGQYFFENITTDNQSFVEKMVGDVDRFFKASTTGTYVAFAVTNFLLLDQATAFVNSRNSFIPIVSPIYNLLMRAVAIPSSQEAQYLKEYLFLSSGSQSSIEMYNRKFTNPTQILRNQAQGKQTILSMISKGWKTLMDALSLAGNVSELSVRGTDYILSRKNGKSPAVALEEAGRLTGSFHHRGRLNNDSATRAALKSPTYLTATLQHLKQYAESAKRTEKDGLLNTSAQQRVVAISAFYIAPVVANMVYLLQNDDEDKKRYETFLTAQSPEILAKYVYLPIQLGGKGYLQIRVPDQYNFIANAFNLAMLSYATDRTYTVKDYYKGATAWIPDQAKIHEPIAQILYSFADKDITTKDNLLATSGYLVKWFPAPIKGAVFTGMEYSDFPEIRQFLSYADKSVLPFEQQNEYTSPLAKYLATQYGESFSPKMFDKFLESVMGRTAKYFTGKETPFTGVNKTFYKELWVSSAYQATEYFNSKDYWQKKIKSMKGKVKENEGGYISQSELNSGASTSYKTGDKFSEANIEEAEELIEELYAINREFRAWQSEAKNSDDVASDQKARIILQAMTDVVERSNKLKEKYRE